MEGSHRRIIVASSSDQEATWWVETEFIETAKASLR